MCAGERGHNLSNRGLASKLAHRGGLLVLILYATFTADAQKAASTDLGGMDIDALMSITVSSVSKKEQKLSQTAAAVFVITQDDIRRSGATSIPDLMRMVPGLDVGQINANTWAITARGFNGQFSNKLLVLIDGRTVYDPSFSGIYWEVQDTLLEDIDRIEIIRGPGATIWGSNAVNGVINITTKTAQETQGGLLTGNAGPREQSGSARYGGQAGSHVFYRAFGKYLNRTSTEGISSQGLADGSRIDRGGFRLDWMASGADTVTVEGDFYSGNENNPFVSAPTPQGYLAPYTSNGRLGGGDVLARWSHKFAGGSELSVQTYVDRLSRVDPADPELRSTVDFDLRDHVRMGRHDIVWGFGYRENWDRLSGQTGVRFTPTTFQSSIANGFIQDEITLVEDKLWFTAGGKLEHNVFTGVEPEPTVSLMWTPTPRNGFWVRTAVASRIPARNDTDITYEVTSFVTPGGVPALVRVFGNPQFQSEKLTAYEIGYRAQPTGRLWFDLTAFRNHYGHLRTLESAAPVFVNAAPLPYLQVPLVVGNKMLGDTYGAEGYAGLRATDSWTLTGGYTWFIPHLRDEPSSTDTVLTAENNGNAPRNQFQIRSQLNLPHHIEWDSTLYLVGRVSAGNIPSYNRLDTRLGWQASGHLEVSVVGQNLLSPRHPEFNETEQKFLAAQIQRSAFLKVTWRF